MFDLGADWDAPGSEPAMTGQLVFDVEDVDALHAAIRDRVDILWGPESYEYGRREFSSKDESGYRLVFGQSIERSARREVARMCRRGIIRAMDSSISVQAEGAIAEVVLRQKTMPPAMFADIEAAFREVSASREVRAVVLRSETEQFSYGLDLREAFKEYGELFTGGGLAGPRTELLELIRTLQRSMTAVAKCPVPVIAAVHGWCIGGGLDLIAACDVRTASADARFSLRETKLGIVADLGSLQRLPRIIGQGHARELAFTGKNIDAERAHAIGLVSEVAADRDGALAAARATAEEIAANPPLVVRGVKQVMDYGEDKSVDDGLEYVAAWNAAFLASEDLGEAVAAFAARRPPEFKGK